MRNLVISDIHSNWEALEAVLGDASGQYDRIVCLGDFVGYGPDPNRVVEWARDHVALSVRGNHDRACADLQGLQDFSPLARQAALWTHDALSSENAGYLRSLPQGPLSQDGFTIVHGSPRGEDEYLVEDHEAADAFPYTENRVTLFGHTHLQGGFEARKGKTRPIHVEIDFYFDPDAAYLINPGSVGQPRDLQPQAAYLLFDPRDPFVTYRRVTYALNETQRKIRQAGLPALLADRLAIGK